MTYAFDRSEEGATKVMYFADALTLCCCSTPYIQLFNHPETFLIQLIQTFFIQLIQAR